MPFNQYGPKKATKDPASNEPGMEFLNSVVLTASAVTTGAIQIPPRDILVLGVRVTGYSGNDIASLRFNGDAANNYWSRYHTSVAGGVAFVNQQTTATNLARLFGLAVTLQRTAIVHIINPTTTSKVGAVRAQTSTGAAATAGTLESGGFEWVNTSAQITTIEMRTAGGSVTMPAGTGFAVWGRNL